MKVYCRWQIELEKKDIDESDNEMESRLFDSDETDIIDSNMLEDMDHLDYFDDEIVGSQFESDDFSEDLFADLPILSKFQNFDDMDDSCYSSSNRSRSRILLCVCMARNSEVDKS